MNNEPYADRLRLYARKAVWATLVAAVALGAGGCVWYRLAKLRWQLGRFQKYFRLEADLSVRLTILEPVARAADIAFVTKLPPSEIETTDRGDLWHYRFRKVYGEGQAEETDRDINALLLVRDQLIHVVQFPPRFREVLDPEKMKALFAAVEEADLDPSRNRADWRSHIAKDKVSRREDILSVLGAPFATRDAGELTILDYHYRLERPQDAQPPEDPDLRVRFELWRQNDRLARCRLELGDLQFNIKMPETD